VSDYTPNVSPTKRCPKCKEHKPATAEYFSRNKSEKDGWQCWCKTCKSKIDSAYNSRLRERAKANPMLRSARYQANREKEKASVRQWSAANPEKRNAMRRRHLARKRNAEGNHTEADIKRQHKAQGGKCYYCHAFVGETYHVDHVIPLSRGGSNGPENIVIACAICNISKQDRLPHEWPQGNRLL
jgi:5-methylcytosine-specific restriction endonuclease McrA